MMPSMRLLRFGRVWRMSTACMFRTAMSCVGQSSILSSSRFLDSTHLFNIFIEQKDGILKPI